MNFKVATQFTRRPGPRYVWQTKLHDSGEEFRDKYVIPLLKECIEKNDTLCVIFDGCSGAGVSFLEESFGGLIRAGIAYNDIMNHLNIIWTSNPRKEAQAKGYIEKAYNVQKGTV